MISWLRKCKRRAAPAGSGRGPRSNGRFRRWLVLAALPPALVATPALAAEPPVGLTEHLIIISIDGLRPDAISRYAARELERLSREGATSLEARTISPSRTLPSHTSMLTGLCPAEHGVTWNDTESGPGDVIGAATIFELARASGLKTAAIFSKPKLRYLQKPGTLDFTGAPGRFANLMATETVEATVRYLKHERPNLLFVHLAEPDYAGHTIGWMSSVYGWAVRRSDAAVRRILEEAESAFGSGNYTVILTADHGGHDRTHGTEDPRDMTIPWIAWGLGVLPGNLSSEPIQTIDTAATALWLLGVEPPEEWSGRPIRAAFVGGEGSADLEEVQDRCAHLL